MNETSGRVMNDSVRPFNNGVIGPAVRLNGSTYEFPGWVNNVDGAGNMVGQISATDSLVSVADAGHVLEPKNGAFSVEGVLQARLTAAGTLPVGARGVAYNIVQKARASNLGGFWKVEMRGNGAGIGSCIAANKIDGARAAVCNDKTTARYSREHNGANVLALGSTLVSIDDAKAIVDTWMATPMGEARYIRRLAKIRALERMP